MESCACVQAALLCAAGVPVLCAAVVVACPEGTLQLQHHCCMRVTAADAISVKVAGWGPAKLCLQELSKDPPPPAPHTHTHTLGGAHTDTPKGPVTPV